MQGFRLLVDYENTTKNKCIKQSNQQTKTKTKIKTKQ